MKLAFQQKCSFKCITKSGCKFMNLLDKNASTGIAMAIVAEIFESCRSTDGRSLIMTSCISSVHRRKAFTHSFAHLETVPNSRHFISSLCKYGQILEIYRVSYFSCKIYQIASKRYLTTRNKKCIDVCQRLPRSLW